MPRANRHHLPGYVWHITHRCHKKEFLFKFVKDRKRWLTWLFKAKKRFGLRILNYVVTSNHIHLLVLDNGDGEISKSIQLVAGRTAQEYNQRKKRNGAFWEDRYHATAIESGKHLIRCMIYIDLNMVRAGAVRHPCEWPFSGYQEIHNPPKRGGLLDRASLMKLCNEKEEGPLKNILKEFMEETFGFGSDQANILFLTENLRTLALKYSLIDRFSYSLIDRFSPRKSMIKRNRIWI